MLSTIYFVLKNLGILIYTVTWEMKNLNKSNFFYKTKKQTFKKHVQKIIKKYGYKLYSGY